MKNKISLIFVVAIIVSCLALGVFPARSSAIIANYEEEVTRQKNDADVYVSGEIISSKYSASEDRRYQSIDYTVEVTKVIKSSDDIGLGTIISMSHDCNAASEMFFITPKSECLEHGRKVGDIIGIYMDIDEKQCDVAPCPQYRQAIIYRDAIIDIYQPYSSNLFEEIKNLIVNNGNVIAIPLVAVGFVVLGIFQSKKYISKKKTKKSKYTKPNNR